MLVTRKYNCKDTELIIGCTKVNQAAQTHHAFLVTQRPLWTDEYFADLEAKNHVTGFTQV